MISTIESQSKIASINQMTYLKRITCIVSLLLLFISTPGFAETTLYVSDDLTIPMRSGTTNRHKILKFLDSGTAVKLLEKTDDESYARIQLDDGKEGWVKMEHLMNTPSARDRLVTTNQKLESRMDEIRSLKDTISDLKNQNSELEQARQKLQQQNSSLEQTLAELRRTAAQPIAIHEENKQLQTKIDELSETNQQLVAENANLNDNSLKEWFIIGAAVAIGSLILGLIIPNIRWRKKDSWAGSF